MAEEPEPEGQPEVPRLEEVQALRETLAAISVRNSGELPGEADLQDSALVHLKLAAKHLSRFVACCRGKRSGKNVQPPSLTFVRMVPLMKSLPHSCVGPLK